MDDSKSKIISGDPKLKTSKQGKSPLQESQFENFTSTAPSGESSEDNTVANQMQRTRVLVSLNTGRCVPPNERRRNYNAIEALN